MNELHEKLLAQAHVEFAPDSKAVTARFAELIVRVCADYIDSFNRKNMVEEGISGDMLKQHFGVEE
jgi:hypothetical protein